VDHPAEWELSMACGLNEPGRCEFADRHYQRLDLRWRPLKYVPNLDRMLDKHRRQEEQNAQLEELHGAPSAWRGVIHKLPDGTVVHAGRFFRNVRWLVETVLVWPENRDQKLENAVLASIAPEDPNSDLRLWQASGMSVTVARRFDLHDSEAKVGRVRWNFATSQKDGPTLSVERIAMPQYWLKGPLREWLVDQLPDGYEQIRQDQKPFNAHRGEWLISCTKARTLSRLRGFKQIRLDLAWLCPMESRAYHVSFTKLSRERDVTLPAHIKVRCCQPTPPMGNTRTGR